MSKRIDRVNQLLQREIAEQLRLRYRSEAVTVTITGVETSPDLRQARVFYSLVGDQMGLEAAAAFFRRVGGDLSRRVSQRVILKYFPRLEFIYDDSMERGAKVLELLDELENENHD